MDIATIIGLIAGSGLVLWGMLSGASLEMFVDYPSVAIVLGGASATALISFPLKDVFKIAKVVKHTILFKTRDKSELIKELVHYAEVARRDGILSLENSVREMDDEFLVSGIQMAVDGTDPELIEAVLESEVDAIEERHAQGKAIFDNIGRFAPAFGMIGTLIGLVKMLANMDDPSKIGAGMAVALLTTMYGALVANLIALPIGEKLGRRSAEELMIKSIIVRGVMAIQSGDNPRVVEQKLLTFLPVSQRVTADDAAEAA
ncbi:MAG TPA: MotA/TolQ/ExbB proton channel family protein [Phycisphaerae bacterium]|nr:MotA/TolQ/ExbB proton channel family protein [Phycisphaerae bacterium]